MADTGKNNDLSVSEMLDMQKKLQDKYSNIWEKICPETGRNKLLWMIGEIGEVIDIEKKSGPDKIMHDEKIRAHFVEECADVLMYLHDIMLCYGIEPEEMRKAYTEKFEKNMHRW